MFKFYLSTLMLFLTCTSGLSQQTPLSDSVEAPTVPKAEKFDEFGRLGDCDLGARTDHLFSSLQKKPDHQAYIINYNGIDVLPGQYDEYPIERLIRNQIVFRGIDGPRITFVRGGFRSTLHTEFWVVPPGAEMPHPTDTRSKPDIPTNRTFLFDKNFIFSEYSDDPAEFLLPSVKVEETPEQVESAADDELTATEEPSPVELELKFIHSRTPEEIEAEKFLWVSERFGALLKSRKLESGVIIFYADDRRYDISQIHQFVGKGSKRLTSAAKIVPEKIKIIFGGYKDSPEVEFWVVPKNGTAPIPKPEDRPIEEVEN